VLPPTYGAPSPPPPGFNAGYAYTPLGTSARAWDGATRVLVMAIVSLVCCGLVLGPVSAIKASGILKQMDAMPTVNWTNRGTVDAARIIGIIATVLAILGLALLIATSGSRAT
jgi:hypothetical protein